MWWTTLCFLALFCCAFPGDGARILAIFPFPSHSHMNVLHALTTELASRGHQLVVASPYAMKKPIINITEVDLSVTVQALNKNVADANYFKMSDMAFHKLSFMMWNIGLGTTEVVMTSPQFEKILKDKEGFDLIIAEIFLNEAIYGLAHHFKAPLVVVCPFGGYHWHNYGPANPILTSYVPNPILEYSDRMSFKERLINTLWNTAWDVGHFLYYMPRMEALAKKVFGPDTPSIHELNQLPSLILVNQHFTLNYPRPLLPNIIEVGGMHVSREVKPLDKEFKDFLDGAKDGAIYFSMGSTLKSKDMGAETVKAFTDAFAELPQRVLWKWEADTLPGQPKNLKVAKWMPQQEILAHPNVKVFITHGGLLSAQEAAYHGKTLVGIPIVGDQKLNVKRAKLGGFAVMLEFKNITKTSVLWALNEALYNPKIVEASNQRSLQYRDQPQTPLEKAIFWTEYIIRHKGAPHLRSAAADLHWFQLNLLDVYAALLAPIIVLLSLCKKCSCSRKKSETTSLKKSAQSKKSN